MQELQTTRQQSVRPTGAVTAQKSGSRNDIADLVDDLCEISFLIDGLAIDQNDFSTDEKNLDTFSSQTFIEVFNNQLRILKSKHTALLDLVERAARWSKLGRFKDLSETDSQRLLASEIRNQNCISTQRIDSLRQRLAKPALRLNLQA